MKDRKRNTIKRARVAPRTFESTRPKAPKPKTVETPGVDPVKIAKDSMHIQTKVTMKLKDTKIARFFSGETKVARILFSILDVLPVPNVHEVVKAAIKNLRARADEMPVIAVVQEIFLRLDWIRTVVAIVVAVLLIRALDWSKLDPELFIDLLRALGSVF